MAKDKNMPKRLDQGAHASERNRQAGSVRRIERIAALLQFVIELVTGNHYLTDGRLLEFPSSRHARRPCRMQSPYDLRRCGARRRASTVHVRLDEGMPYRAVNHLYEEPVLSQCTSKPNAVTMRVVVGARPHGRASALLVRTW